LQQSVSDKKGLKKIVLGVDIGGTNSKFGFVDRDGNCLAGASIPTNADQPAESFFRRLQESSKLLLASLGPNHDLAGIGIGAPNANYYKGTIEYPPNLGWGYVDVRAEISKYFEVPVAITNDANAAALGEMLFGAAQGMRDFIVITLGTGLGSGIVANGELIYGADGFAGEIGHTTVDPNGRECGCGKRGCLEAYCSATGLCRTVQELICATNEPSELRRMSYENITAEKIYEAALRRDRLALQAFESCGAILGLKLADSVAHLSPEAIILFGGLAAAGDLIFNPTKRSLESHLFPVFRNKVKLLPSRLGKSNTAILGAGALIWKSLDTVK
jgi:glucokinase